MRTGSAFGRGRGQRPGALIMLWAAAAVALAQPGPAQVPVPGLPQGPAPAAAPALPFGLGTIPYAVPGAAVPAAPAQSLLPAQSTLAPGVQRAAALPPARPSPPKGPTQLIDLPRMDNRAITELISGLVTRLELESGYAEAQDAHKLPPVPAKVVAVGPVLSRMDAQKRTLLLRFGFLRQAGQLPQLWASGIVAPDPATPNPDAALIEPAVMAILASREKSEADIAITDLRAQVINLAYVDADGAIGMLKAMGFNTSGVDKPWAATSPITPYGSAGSFSWPGASTPAQLPATSGWGYQQPASSGAPLGWGMPGQAASTQAQASTQAGPRKVRNADLPLVIRMPAPNPQDVGLVGAAPDGSAAAPGTGQSGVTTILGVTGRLSPETLSSPTTQLMVLYNPDRPEQLGMVRKAVAESIDTPARQIVIEAMVLEVTSSGLRDLGVQWNYQKGLNSLLIGSLTPGTGADTLNFVRDRSLPEAVKSFFVKVQALVQSGKAEVLARPSVLTLDNRQATIRVGTDIPIATSRDASSGVESRVSYSFFYLPTGIQLNVRPRIDNEGSEVSLQVDAAVSTTVANLGAQIRSPGDVVLAAAPAVSTRRVQTYARIPNSTPLIIGGLISRTRDEIADATPLLGELPVVGALFRGKKDTSTRDEVIIVLTPYVLEQGRTGLVAAMPKDAPAFEYSRDNELFRRNIRLRAEDMLNLAYIRENARLVRYRQLVNRIAAADMTRVLDTPLEQVLGNRTPGEKTLMSGMLFHVLRKHDDAQAVPPQRMQLFMERDGGKIVIRSLADVLARLGDGTDPASFFSRHPAKCLAITFASHRQELVAGNVLAEPEPRIRTVDCRPDRSDWSRILYELNRNTAQTEFNTILIKDASDLRTLSHAIALRRLIQINGGRAAVDFDHLGVGRVLALPEFGPGQDHTLESDIALYFYLSQHYYRAFEEDFEEAMAAIENELRSGKFNDIVSPGELPPAR